jgi:ABC-type branched-subunit amino acid transport system permease subunit
VSSVLGCELVVTVNVSLERATAGALGGAATAAGALIGALILLGVRKTWSVVRDSLSLSKVGLGLD